jgi:predicted TIM-barrel fold metal-dependent hydrolase
MGFNYRNISRRKFVTGTAISAAGMFISNNLIGKGSVEEANKSSVEKSTGAFDIVNELKKYRKIDSYATSNFSQESIKSQLNFADKLHIEKLFIAMPMRPIKATPQEFREINDTVLKIMKKYPDRLKGQLTLNPIYRKESLEEINRCVDQGMVGTRIYNQVKINNPLFYPIIEKFIDLKMIIFIHGEAQLGVGGYRMKYDAGKAPTISRPEDFMEVAKRYPEAMFQFPHIGGGGDWEYMCKSFENYPNIYVDTGGSNNEENMIGFALETLGEDRLFFGSDSSFYQSVGKVLSSDLTEAQKNKLFFDNYNNVLRKGGYHVA